MHHESEIQPFHAGGHCRRLPDYLAYELARDLINGVPSQMPKALTVIIVILFTGIGVTLLVYAWKLWKKSREGNEEDRVEIREEEDSATDEEQGAKK